ncbi:hypothetical protein KRZ98_09935 [Sphingobium sp. AS12]|uniref:hypothetical protein n=1 Tax=Sphingobium sp. AS12 TaxID=2849495 RepID=UPI001C31C587|nr:hypothetical protein [Sphingobium sp. AS12]MBV2148604.1 hypothetical protein [Sphingobium sp. AS12]
MEQARQIQEIIDKASEAYRSCPAILRNAVLRSGVEFVPALDRIDASNELALAAAAAVSAGMFNMISCEIQDAAAVAGFRAAYFQLIARAIDNMAKPIGSLQ